MIKVPVLIEGDISYELRATSVSSAYIEFELFLLGERFVAIDLAFEYRLPGSSDWLADASLLASRVEDNHLMGVGCDIIGSPNTFRWIYPDNGIALGSDCEVRLRVLPFANLLMDNYAHSRVEGLSLEGRYLVGGPAIPYKVFNLGYNQRRLCLNSTSLIVLDSYGTSEFVENTLTDPVWVQQKRDGRYLVLNGDDHLWEIDQYAGSSVILNKDLSGSVTNAKHFVYDELTSNVLIAGYDTGSVYEFNWGIDIYDTPIAVATPARTYSTSLTQPIAAAYYPDRSKIVIVDQGNPPGTPAKLVTLNWVTGAVSSVTQITVRGTAVDLSKPFIPFVMEDDTVVVVEQSGANPAYNASVDVHPALVRSGVGTGTGADTLEEYKGLVFAPITRSF